MQKYNDPCITTSQFAKLCNTSKRTLIHYDEIGLFKPAYIDERGYRFYSETQCDTFFTITCLKDLGMPLKEIRTYINHRNPEDLTALLLSQQEKVRQELQYLRRLQQIIDNKLALVSEGRKLRFHNRCSEPHLEEFPEEIMITTPILDTSEHEILFSAICEHIGTVNHERMNIGHPYGAMIRVSDLLRGRTGQYACFMTKTTPYESQHLLHQKPGGLYAVIYLQGDYYQADEAFRKLLNFIQKQNLCAGEFCYKEAIWDELTVEHSEDFITRISISVTK